MIEFRPLAEADLPMLCDWLNRPHLQRWWREGKVTPGALRSKYLPRIAGDDDARPFIATDGGDPIGYLQVYRADTGSSDWWPDRPDFGVLGIDQFLADGDALGRGVGTRMVAAFVRRLLTDSAFVARTFAEPRFAGTPVTEIRVDPRPENLRAIRCYENVGFERVAEITTPDGPAVMMVLRAEDREALPPTTSDSAASR